MAGQRAPALAEFSGAGRGAEELLSRDIDPITFEVIQNGLASLVDEMALTVMRTAYSGVVKDAMDYSTAFCDGDGEVVAQGLTIVVHLGSFPDAVRSILTKFKGRIYEGDMFILNDPYTAGGIHLPDVYVFKPVFAAGRLDGFAGVVAHHTDVGGIVPGSNSTESREIYQEGLRIPALKLLERGVPNEAVFDFITTNVRVPDKVLGDLRSQIAAANTGERGYLQLVQRYGADGMRRYSRELLDYAERRARAEIAALPKGTWEFTDHIDADNIEEGPVIIQCRLTIREDSIALDFDGSSPQVPAGINSPIPFSRAAVYGAIRLVLDPTIPTSSGFNRAIDIRMPPGSVVNPVLPAACGARGITGFRVMDAVLGALAGAIPQRVAADGEGGNTLITIGGYDDRSRGFAYVDFVAGARGGRPDADGPEGVPHPASNMANIPVEIAELEAPVRIEEYSIAPDTGGPGKYRGACAQIRRVRCLTANATLQLRSDKRRYVPHGLNGGGPGTPSKNILNPGRGEKLLPTMCAVPIRKDDVILHVMAGAGGWGDPLERDSALVMRDVLDEKLTIDYVLDRYGVVIDPTTLAVDEAATYAVRAELRARRA
jgi:N-methylhydantoinase B